MTKSDDPAFTVWLQSLPKLGYPRDWIRHNMPALKRAYETRQGAPMPPCPPPPSRPQDRYEEL